MIVRQSLQRIKRVPRRRILLGWQIFTHPPVSPVVIIKSIQYLPYRKPRIRRKVNRKLVYRLMMAPGAMNPPAPPQAQYTFIPMLIGQLLANALILLAAARLAVGTIRYVAHSAQAGIVIGMGYQQYIMVPVGTHIDLVVSLGRPVGTNNYILPQRLGVMTPGNLKPTQDL